MSTTIPTINPRKSGRKIRKPERMDDINPNPKGVVSPPTYILMSNKVPHNSKCTIPTTRARKMISVLQVKVPKPKSGKQSLPCTIDVDSKVGSCSSSSSDGYHPSDNYDPHQLYKNWMLSKDTVKDCKSSNKDLLAEVCKLKKDLTVSEKSMDSLRDSKKNFSRLLKW